MGANLDAQDTGSVGAIAVAASDPNVLYVGSGEGLQRPDLATGDGVYKSTDAGKTWTHLGLRDAQQITAILVDPQDANRLFVAVQGHPYGPNKSGVSSARPMAANPLKKILYKDENVGAADLVFDPSNTQTIYAVLWAARVAPWEIRSGESFVAPGSGLYKSIDGGAMAPANQGPAFFGRAVSAASVLRLRKSTAARIRHGGSKEGSGCLPFRRRRGTWSLINSDRRIGGRGPGAMGIAVAPTILM